MTNKASWTERVFLGLVFILLYAPIIILIIFSFNESRYITIWQGASLKWYLSIFSDKKLINAALTSLNIAIFSATISTMLGTISGFIIAKFVNFRGRTIFTGLLITPFIVPEVIIGFSLLMLFILLERFLGWPNERSSLTVICSHITVSLAYVAFIVQARMQSIDPSIEEAALDLGASPIKVLLNITLPMISKSITIGWLLAFTLSFDDVVIASFTSGARSTTLPMLIYSKIRFGISPQINALASIFIAGIVSIITFAYILNKPKDKA